jgi:hypothetical protein
MIEKKLPLFRFLAAVVLSVLVCACKNDANSLDFVQDGAKPTAETGTAAPSDADHLNRIAKQSSRRPSPPPAAPAEETDAGFIQVKLVKKGAAIKSEPPLAPQKHTKTKLAEFQHAPFPYHGTVPSTGRPFLDAGEGGRRGHRTSSGTVYWEDQTYKDSRTLLHIPRGFDVRRPALMVVSFMAMAPRCSVT